jgi:hypothetical protein
MSAYAQKTLNVFDNLSEAAQISVLRFVEFLALNESEDEYLPYSEDEMEEDIALYDEAMANDCGYRISLEDFSRKHGI